MLSNVEHLPAFLREDELEHVKNVVSEVPYLSFKGNVLFASKNALKGMTISRRDDVISLVYLLVFLMNCNTNKYEV